ncbi:hypothetical protein HYS95_01840 [Candidatus Daviesbacteria bacterium]|nr:hypothetical protein [Candidatus Daviesbacteria bacterium]
MRKIIYLIPFLPILVWLPLLLVATMPSGHDLYAHLTYAKLFEKALGEGQFPVRWMEWIKPGFSQPLFNFYQVGFYYLVSLVSWLPVSFLMSAKLAILFLWWLGTFFTFLFARRFGVIPATIACIIYAFSPYLILDIFVRNAFPEFMAISLMPAVFWAADRLISTARAIFIIPFALFLGTSAFSHLPATLIFLPVLVLYSLMLMQGQNRLKRKLVFLGLASVLAFGLAAFYLMPAVIELNLVQINKIKVDNFDFHRHFVNAGQSFLSSLGDTKHYTNFHFQLQSIQAISVLVLVAGSFFVIRKKMNQFLLFWMGMLIYAWFFSGYDSLVVWEKVKFLGFIQFPWRFLMVTPLALAVLAAYFCQRIKSSNFRLITLPAAILLGVFSVMFYLKPVKFTDVAYFNLPFAQWAAFPKTQQRAFLEPAYYPKEVKTIPNEDMPLLNPQTGVEVNEKKISSGHLILEVSSPKPASLVVNTHYFPGWTAYINGKTVQVNPTDANFIGISVPAGGSLVEVKFADTKLRMWANIISLASLVILILVIWLEKLFVRRSYFLKLLYNIPARFQFPDIH